MKNRIIRSVRISGTGSYLPETVVTNAQLARQAPTTDEWIRANLGVEERRIAAPDQATSDLAAESARRAMESAGVLPRDIDLIIVATATPDRLAP
jgi:3-oxoacyl-[acyl-carrier-protein] synthase-3